MPNAPKEWEKIEFSATVPADMRLAVEALFFFNPRQSLLIKDIRATVEAMGSPEIREDAGRLWIDVPSGSLQCLFACNTQSIPVGVLLYGRPSREVLEVVHLAVNPTYAFGEGGAQGVGMLLVGKVQEIACRIKGVSRIQLPYRPGFFLRLDRAGRQQPQPAVVQQPLPDEPNEPSTISGAN
jgi:hypothetical protein